MIIVAGRRIITNGTAMSWIPIHFDVTDVAVHKAHDVFGIVIHRAVLMSNTVR
jgi:hypothetical protein